MPKIKFAPTPTEVISREKAIAQGLPHFFTGKPCKRGHLSLRPVKSRVCVACSRENSRANYANSPVEVRRAEMLRTKERDKELRALEIKRMADLQTKWKAQKLIDEASRRRWGQDLIARKIAKRNRTSPFYMRADGKCRGTLNAIAAIYRARACRAIPKWANLEEIRTIYLEAARVGKHVDHIVPLAGDLVCGLHVTNNLQLLDPTMNIKKSNNFDPMKH